MNTRKVVFPNGLAHCPSCGNRHDFVAVWQQVMKEGCEVWLRCGSCGHEPGWQERRGWVWGGLDPETLASLGQDWNQWVFRQ